MGDPEDIVRLRKTPNPSGSWEEGESEGEEGVARPEKDSPLLGCRERPFFDQNVKHQPPRHTPFSAQKRGREFRHFRVWKKANPHGVLVFLVVTLLFCDLFWFHCFSPIPTVCGRIGAIFSVLFFAICLNQNIDFLINSLKTSSGSAFFALGGDLGHSS